MRNDKTFELLIKMYFERNENNFIEMKKIFFTKA